MESENRPEGPTGLCVGAEMAGSKILIIEDDQDIREGSRSSWRARGTRSQVPRTAPKDSPASRMTATS